MITMKAWAEPLLLAAALLTLPLAGCDRQPSAARTSTAEPAQSAAPATEPPNVAAGIHYLMRYSGGANSGEALPLVVAIHGLGDRPKRFAHLLGGLDARARLVFPRGLASYHGGFSWFDLDDSKTIRSTAEKLAAMLTTLRRRYPTVGKPIVTGFSQGGVLSFALAVAHPDQLSLALPDSGWLPPELLPAKCPVGAPPIVALHGDADARLRIEPTRQAVGKLRAIGCGAELIEYPAVRHTVSDGMRRELFRRLTAGLAVQVVR